MEVVVLPSHGLLRALRVAVVAHEQPRRVGLFQARHADGALLAVIDLAAVVVEQLHVEQGRRLAHGAGPRLDPREGGQKHRALGLAEALADLLAGEALPPDGHFRVQGLASRGEVLHAGQVVGGHVLLQHEAVHGRRRAEGGELVVLNLLQKLGGHELVHVVGEDGGTGDPLAVDLAPAELGPTGVGHRHVQLVLLHLLPVLRRYDVAERMGEVVLHGLGVARRAAREVHEHDVFGGDARLAGRTLEGIGVAGDELVEIDPALAGTVHDELLAHRGAIGHGLFHLRADVLVVHGDDGLHVGAVGTVDHVLARELQRRGDDGGAQLAEGHGAHPVLPAAAQDAHDHVALADAELLKGVGGLVGQALDVGEREHTLLAGVVGPQKRPLVGLHGGPLVDDVETEVEGLGNLDGEVLGEVLVGIELNSRAVLLQNMIHSGASLCSPISLCPSGASGYPDSLRQSSLWGNAHWAFPVAAELARSGHPKSPDSSSKTEWLTWLKAIRR